MKQSSIWYELETKGEYLMERTIVVANQKGGVGKTTTAINLAASLAELGKKVLVVDMDPQGNTTSGLGIDKEQAENTVYELMLEECSVEDAIMESEYENLSVLPSNINMQAAEIELVGAEEKEYILKKAIDKVKKNYDFVLIDCPPSFKYADYQCNVCGRYGTRADSVRILCTRGTVSADPHNQSCPGSTEPGSGNRRRGIYHVRCKNQSVSSGGGKRKK